MVTLLSVENLNDDQMMMMMTTVVVGDKNDVHDMNLMMNLNDQMMVDNNFSMFDDDDLNDRLLNHWQYLSPLKKMKKSSIQHLQPMMIMLLRKVSLSMMMINYWV